MIAAYQAGVQPPTISILNEGKTTAEEITGSYNYYDETASMSLDDNHEGGNTKIYFMANDINFVKGEKSILVNLYYEDPKSRTTIDYSTKNSAGETIVTPVKVKQITNLPIYELDGKLANQGNASKKNNELESGKVYYISIPDSEIENVMKTSAKFRMYFQASTVITNQGLNGSKSVNVVGPVYAQYDITRINLFDLQ
jgi:hypothetical protein